MNAALIGLAVVTPLAIVLLATNRTTRNTAAAIAPGTAVFGLAAALLVRPGTTFDLPWLLLGARLGIDAIGQVFLAFTSLLWLLAGIYGHAYLRQDPHRSRFFAFYLASMAGNFGLILAQDLVTFTLFFAIMSFSAYGLITHHRDTASRQAGQTYLVLVVLGETLLFAGLVLAALEANSLMFEDVRAAVIESPVRDIVIGLLLVGFGIKVGMVPLHFWLPLAHPIAPTPASAVLSGAMIKAGLLGWIRFLPLGEAILPHWGGLCIVAGLFATFYGVIVGLTQARAKTVLAYSSVSQMGLVLATVGSGFAQPGAWPVISAALALFAFHHAIAKGALFLGAGIADRSPPGSWTRWLVLAGLLLPALALAGAPFTLGGAAKAAIKHAATAAARPWGELFATMLPLSAIATTLLLSRLLYLAWSGAEANPPRLRAGMWWSWSLLVANVFWTPWRSLWQVSVDHHWFEWSAASLWKGAWPILVGTGLALLAASQPDLNARLSRLKLPMGDIYVPLAAGARRLADAWHRYLVRPLAHFSSLVMSWWSVTAAPNVVLPFSRLSALESWAAVGTLALLIAVALFVLLTV